jgi:hypothetical protein
MLDNLGLSKVEVTDNSNDITLRFKDGFVVMYTAEAMKEEETEDPVTSAAETVAAEDPQGKKPTTQALKRYRTILRTVETKLPTALDNKTAGLKSVVNNIK